MTFLIKETFFQYVKETYTKQCICTTSCVFVINLKKSQIVPTQRVRILDFVIDSVKMIVTLTEEKKQKLKTLLLNLLRINKPTIRYLAKVIGIIISCMLAAILGPLFYRYLENDKVTSLRLSKGNFYAPAKICSEGKPELEWCLKMLTTFKNLPWTQLILNIFVTHIHILRMQILTHTQDRWCLEYERNGSPY